VKSTNLLRNLGFVALTVVAVGGLGVALGGGRSSTSSTQSQASGTGFAWPDQPDEIMTSIDKTLGRQTTTVDAAGKPVDAAVPSNAATEKSSGGSAGSSNVVPPPGAPVPSTTAPKQDGVVGTTTGTDVNPVAGVDDRKIVQTASIKMQVKEVGGGFQDVSRIAAGAGGFVASSNFSYQGDAQIASLTIRVPSEKYQDVMQQLRGVGAKVDSETSSGSDVTDEYTDLDARLRTLQATETQLLTLLGNAKNMTEILQVQDRLNTVRGQIETAKGRQALLTRLSDLATISVSLRPVPVVAKTSEPSTGLRARADEAWSSSLDFLGDMAGGVLTVLVFSWWLPIVAVPVVVAGKRLNRRHAEAVAD